MACSPALNLAHQKQLNTRLKTILTRKEKQMIGFKEYCKLMKDQAALPSRATKVENFSPSKSRARELEIVESVNSDFPDRQQGNSLQK
jgi:CRISPR/Cas system-associated protein endoribonuclease Cas2